MNKTSATGKVFGDEVTVDVLTDVCNRITGQSQFTYEYVGNDYEDEFIARSYNRGRTAIMQYRDEVSYISFSEQEIGGRNSSVQSVPTAYNMFYRNIYEKKNIYYYFLDVLGNADTSYQKFIYRLMCTVGFVFLNDQEAIGTKIQPFNSIEDIMFNRRINTGRNQSNNPTYMTKSSAQTIEVYGKTFGANKYETSLLCYALAMLCHGEQNVKLYQVVEGNLTILPAASLDVIRQMGKIELIQTDMRLEKIQFEDNNSLRSPRYTYNLLNKLGKKHCALCNCEIPELIQGAHIWPVSAIKKAPALTMEQRLDYALDGENGLWLCENHHKMFDEHLITFDQQGKLLFHKNIDRRHMKFIDEVTKYYVLPDEVLTEQFLWYLRQRHQAG